jgi:ABC-type Mn2+/Zn2+ transport system permease subunit
MLLAGDVISHLALPGLGVAFLFKVNPLLGGAATLFLGTLLIWKLQKKTGLATEAMTGVVFAAALALGAVVTPKEDLVDALFGGFPMLSLAGLLFGVMAVAVVIVFIVRSKDRLALSLFSTDLATVSGVNVNRLNLYFLFVFSLTVLIGLQFMGTLLSSALIIMPAAVGRQLTNKFSHFLIVSSTVSVFSVAVGFLANSVVKSPTVSPVIVIVSALLFALSLVIRRKQ